MKKILFAASEALPFAASGGLGDVAGSLPSVIAAEGNDVRVVMPLYSKMSAEYRESAEFLGYIYVTLGWRRQYCGIFTLEKDGVVYYFIDNEYYFKRDRLYGEYDDAERFAFFSKAVLDILPFVDFMPDILHCNDWQTALSVVYLKKQYGLVPGYADIKAIFTIHNIQYQGRYGKELLTDLFGLDPKELKTLEYDGDLNLLKGAIVCADAVTTVSPTYAKEILSPQFHMGCIMCSSSTRASSSAYSTASIMIIMTLRTTIRCLSNTRGVLSRARHRISTNCRGCSACPSLILRL